MSGIYDPLKDYPRYNMISFRSLGGGGARASKLDSAEKLSEYMLEPSGSSREPSRLSLGKASSRYGGSVRGSMRR